MFLELREEEGKVKMSIQTGLLFCLYLKTWLNQPKEYTNKTVEKHLCFV